MFRNEDVLFKVLRNGGEYAFLAPKDGSKPSLRNRAGGEIKLSLQGTFLPTAYDENGNEKPIDWLTDEVQPVLVLDGVESKLGVLAVAKVENNEDDAERLVSLELYDRCWRVRETKTESILHIAQGVNYLQPIEELLTACGITNIVKTPTTETLKEAREEWDIGTSYLKIVNDLLKEIGYKQLWFDAAGSAVLQPKEKATARNVKHVLSNRRLNIRDKRTVGIIGIKSELKRNMDVYNAANVFVCSCANPDKSGIMVATAENTNPQSPISIPRRGRRIVDYENVNNIASQDALQKYADDKRDKSMISNEVIQVTTLLQPGFGTEEIVCLQIGEGSEAMDAICVETSWDMQLGVGGLMTHELERTVYNLD